MSGFKSSKSNPFVKKAYNPNGYAGKKFEPTKSDSLMKVVSYDLPKYTIVAERVFDGKQLRLRVSKEAVERCRKSENEYKTAKWFGHLIDARMQKEIKVGNVFVAENAMWLAKDGDTPIFECTRIHSIPSQRKGKVISGKITVSAIKDRVSYVQVWEDNARNPTQANIDEYAKRMDDIQALVNSGKRSHSIGFQFRVVVGDQVVEQSECFDYIQALKDEQGTVVVEGHAYSGQEFRDVCAEFAEYVKSNGLGQWEICFYRNYKASDFSKDMAITSAKGHKNFRLDSMANGQSRLKIGGDVQVGKSYCVAGIVAMTDDDMKEDENGDFVRVPRDMVQKLFINGVAGNIHAFVRREDGSKVSFLNELKVYTKNEAPAKEAIAEAAAILGDMEDDGLFDNLKQEIDETDPFSN